MCHAAAPPRIRILYARWFMIIYRLYDEITLFIYVKYEDVLL